MFENVAAYGEYAPDYREKTCSSKSKRQLDLNEHVAAFRYSETQLQSLLDQIVQALAEEVSNEIKIDAGSPFFETKNTLDAEGIVMQVDNSEFEIIKRRGLIVWVYSLKQLKNLKSSACCIMSQEK